MKRLDLSYANRGLTIQTMAVHSMTFHADDVFAAMLIRAIYPNIQVIRTRDQDIIESCDIVADVGLIYDPENLRFDHHQEGRAGARENGILFSAFGLIWKHWGLEVCKGDKDLFGHIDKKLVQPIDAADNGQSLYEKQLFEGVDEIGINSVFTKILRPITSHGETFDEQFIQAMDIAELLFSRFLAISSDLFDERKDILDKYEAQDDDRYLIDTDFRPVLAFIEDMPNLLYYVYPYDKQKGTWCIKCAQDSKFINRKGLPKEWAGKSGKGLEEVSGIKGMQFCHNNLFICGADSKEAILEALQAALDD